MDFIEIDDHVDYDNMGYVENGTFFENITQNDNVDNSNIDENDDNPDENDNQLFNRFFPQQTYLPPKLVDNKTFYQDFITKNPQRQQNKQPVSAPTLKTNVTQPLPEKKVTYDDILSSLNMKVVNGKLQIVRGDDTQNQIPQRQSKMGKVNSQTQVYTKQSDFYNKFLQAQQQQMSEEVEEVELTPEQITAQQEHYKRLMMIQYIKNQQQRMRVGQVKSKKMKFV
jgi:hypothetical protein